MAQKKTIRVAAGIFALLLLAAVLLSAFYLAIEAGHHDCACENCPVCACLRLCRNLLAHLSALTKTFFALRVVRTCTASAAFVFIFVAAGYTPVARKVRLDR